MGWFGNFISGARKTIGKVGGVVRKIGRFGESVAAKIGDFAAPVSAAGAAIAGLFGRPDVAEKILEVGEFFSSGKAAEVGGLIGDFGDRIEKLGIGGT